PSRPDAPPEAADCPSPSAPDSPLSPCRPPTPRHPASLASASPAPASTHRESQSASKSLHSKHSSDGRCRAGVLRGQRSHRDAYIGFAKGLPLVGVEIFQATNGSPTPKGVHTSRS